LATVILIAITLIAAIAIAGFVFGLFGTFTSGPRLQLSTVSCVSAATAGGGNGYCKLAISNTGGASGSVTGCSVYGFTGISGTVITTGVVTAAVVPIAAGTAAPGTTVYCEASASAAVSAGSAVSGSLVVASGSPLAFSGIAS